MESTSAAPDALDFNDLVYFVHVVDHGGYSAAERALGIPRSRLSRRVSELESLLGVRLLQRSTRRLALTDAGERLLKRCRLMLAEAQSGLAEISQLQESPSGKVTVSCPLTASRVLLAPLLPRFLERYPAVRVEVLVTNRTIDLYNEGVDIALKVGTRIEEAGGVVTKVVWRSVQRLVAAPALLKREGRPRTPQDLKSFPTLDSLTRRARHTWSMTSADGRRAEHQHHPRLISDDMESLRQAAISGLGIVRLPEVVCNADVAAGRLALVLPDWSVSPHLLYAVFLSRRGLMPAARHFIDFISAQPAEPSKAAPRNKR
ncbi:MAG TPA: LysR substrate-binding domain-containing protein [Burkholderiales bacterium]|nr:LysR substrate-binding domain-containing protein [Burkholderiales bacterium]